MKYVLKLKSGGTNPGDIAKRAQQENQNTIVAQAISAVTGNQNYDNMSFSQAFASARKSGVGEFTWKGKRYTTQLAEEKPKAPAQVVAPTTPTTEVPSVTSTPISGFPYQSGLVSIPGITPTQATPTPTPTQVNKSGVPQSALQSTTTQPRRSSFMERGLFGWALDNLRRIDQQNRAAQAENKRIWNEKYSKLQQGGGIYKRNLLERFFNIKPVQQADTLATNVGNTGRPEIGYSYTNGNNPTIISEIVKPVSYGNGSLISTRRITNPNTPKADTTYIAPSGQRVVNPTDVTRYKSRFGLLDQLIQKRQQGGTVENTEGLYADFAVRLLKGLGVEEDQIVVDGQLNSEYSDFVINSIKAVDTPEFWSNYSEDPDNAVNEFISSIASNQEGSPEDQTNDITPQQDNVDFAKKGAKLKKLRKNKTMKCKCGCAMTTKKEGGKLVSKCSCGCKN